MSRITGFVKSRTLPTCLRSRGLAQSTDRTFWTLLPLSIGLIKGSDILGNEARLGCQHKNGSIKGRLNSQFIIGCLTWDPQRLHEISKQLRLRGLGLHIDQPCMLLGAIGGAENYLDFLKARLRHSLLPPTHARSNASELCTDHRPSGYICRLADSKHEGHQQTAGPAAFLCRVAFRTLRGPMRHGNREAVRPGDAKAAVGSVHSARASGRP